jgi:hypothetical protein
MDFFFFQENDTSLKRHIKTNKEGVMIASWLQNIFILNLILETYIRHYIELLDNLTISNFSI